MTDSQADDSELIPAATVLVCRNRDDGFETLMLRRNSKIAFGGMWVFPGGRVDPADHNAQSGDSADQIQHAARNAAAREAAEEAGLTMDPAALVPWSFWVPPAMASIATKGPRRRFSTWFFVGHAPEGEVIIDDGEIHDFRWYSPTEALETHQQGDIELVPPTWITLTQLAEFDTVEALLTAAEHRESNQFHTHPLGGKPPAIAWAGDDAHPETSGNGGRHRLTLTPGAWSYEVS